MTVTFNESFDAGPDGAAITNANTTYDNIVEAGTGTAEFDSDQSVAGGMSALLTTSAAGDSVSFQDDFASRSLDHRSWYVQIPSNPPDHSTLSFVTTGSVAALLEIMSTGTVRIRDGFSAVDTGALVLPLDVWHRIDWQLDSVAGTQECRVFVGANLHGSTPDETLSGAYTGGAFIGFRDGITTDVGGAWSMRLDEVRGDDAAYPAPAVTPDVTARIHEARLVLPQAATASARIHEARLVLPASSAGAVQDGAIWIASGGTLHPFRTYVARGGQLVPF